MLIFNCSRAFAGFIEPKAKAGTSPVVVPPPSADLASDAELLRDHSGERVAHIQQWVVHLVRVRRQPCVIAMEAQTRYAMLFTGLRKGDVAGFINRLVERLANEMAFAAGDTGMASDLEVLMAEFLAQHGEFRFFQRPERSVQAHLNDVAWQLKEQVTTADDLPQGHEQCAVFDAFANRLLRSTRDKKDYFVPAEEMLVDWLSRYGGLTLQGETRLREVMLQALRAQLTQQIRAMGSSL